MTEIVKTEKALGKALKSNASEIIIEGELAGKVFRIIIKGKVVWAIAFGAIVVAVVAILAAPATAGTSSVASLIVAPAAVGVLGASTTASAIAIAVAAGGAGALNKLRKYKVVERSGDRIVLRK